MDIPSQTPRDVQADHELNAITEQVTSAMIQSVTEKHISRLRFPSDMEQLFQQFFDIKIYGWLHRLGKLSMAAFAVWFVISLFFPELGVTSQYSWTNALLLLVVVVISYISAFYVIKKIPFLLYQRISSFITMQLILYIVWLRLEYGMLLSAFLSMFIGRLLTAVFLRMRFWDGTIYTIIFTIVFHVVLWLQTGDLYLSTFSDSIVVTAITIGMTYLLELEMRREFLHVATIHHLAIHDALTGVFNRRHFMNQLDKEVALAQRYQLPFTLLMIDLDSFKEVNDRYGHAAGDEALRVIAQLCIQELRVVDCFARIGGEEFAVLLPNTNIDGAIELAERLRTKVAEKVIISDDQHFSCTLSLGVTQLKQSDKVATDLLDRADDSLYRAKHNGKNQVVAL